jgi:hypothetical protein
MITRQTKLKIVAIIIMNYAITITDNVGCIFVVVVHFYDALVDDTCSIWHVTVEGFVGVNIISKSLYTIGHLYGIYPLTVTAVQHPVVFHISHPSSNSII